MPQATDRPHPKDGAKDHRDGHTFPECVRKPYGFKIINQKKKEGKRKRKKKFPVHDILVSASLDHHPDDPGALLEVRDDRGPERLAHHHHHLHQQDDPHPLPGVSVLGVHHRQRSDVPWNT